VSLYSQHPELVAYLAENLRGGAKHYILAEYEPALVAWIDAIDEHGHLEIPARCSATWSPLLSDWPQYVR
jgi:hypothetical protein